MSTCSISRTGRGKVVTIKAAIRFWSSGSYRMEDGPVNAHTLVVTFDPGRSGRAVVADTLGSAADVVYLPDLAEADRSPALRQATIVLSHNTGKELRPGEHGDLAGARLIQFMTAGVDFIPLHDLPPDVPVASNGGAYAEPMAEHALAMTLAAAKRLLVEHAALARGAFNQFAPNRMLAGRTCGILGFGGIGVATARLMRAVGMRVHAINRRGRTQEQAGLDRHARSPRRTACGR